MKIVSIIPARSGSKRLKNKNISRLGDKPLINHILEKLVHIKVISKIIISTDYPQIDKFIKKKNKKIIIEKRPKELASDKSTALDVVKSIMKKYPNFDVYSYHLPTCPFVSKIDLTKGFNIKKKKNIDFSVSVIKYEDPIEIAVKFQNDKNLIKPVFNNLKKNKTNSLQIPQSFRPSGGFYIGKKSSIMKYGNFFSGKVYGIKFSNKKFVDIDTKKNLDYANFLLKK